MFQRGTYGFPKREQERAEHQLFGFRDDNQSTRCHILPYVVAFVLDYMLGSLEMETGMVTLSMMTSQPPVRTITSTESALVATVSEAMVGALALASKSASLRSARWNCKC